MIPIIVAIWIVSSTLIAIAGQRFRFGFWGYLFGSLLLSPVIGFLLLVAAIPVRDRRRAPQARERGTP